MSRSFLLVALALSVSTADARQSSKPAADLAAWRGAHGSAWREFTDPATGRLEMLYGGRASAAFQPREDADFERLARRFLEESEGLHGVAGETLEHDKTLFLPLGQFGSTDKLTVRYRQQVAGVPLVGGAVNVLMDAQSGALLSIQSTARPGVELVSTQPALGAEAAAAIARAAFEAKAGAAAEAVSAAGLVLLPREAAPGADLAWQLDLRRELAGARPAARRTWIDAHTGAVLASDSLVHDFDVSGTVRSMSSPGTKPDVPTNPEQPMPAPYIQVTSPVGMAKANADGEFVFPGVDGPIPCTFTYTGTYARVTNLAGPDYSMSLSLSGTGNQVMLNSAATEHLTAQANAYEEINALRDWVRGVIPGDDTADFQALARCNMDQSCNAYFDGTSINFFTSGYACVNTSYATVVAHEMGHWLNNRYGTGNGTDGMGEGNADVFAMYLYDTPIMGEDFCGNGCHTRTGGNLRQFCGDCCTGCNGDSHTNGEVWMGAAWKVRRNLNTVHGDSTGDAIADTLFMSWMNAYDQMQLRSVIEAQWLTLDDDDGFLENGTPNHAPIDSGFREQGFPGVDLAPCFQETYCVGAPNSAGTGARIACTSSLSVGQNDTELSVSGAPAGQVGLFYYGTAQTELPFGDGLRCVGGETFRLPLVTVGVGGSADWALDMNAPPAPGGRITAGSTWYFQFWYRDPAAGGANFNLSDALALGFCD